jgi:hypothetical protein
MRLGAVLNAANTTAAASAVTEIVFHIQDLSLGFASGTSCRACVESRAMPGWAIRPTELVPGRWRIPDGD